MIEHEQNPEALQEIFLRQEVKEVADLFEVAPLFGGEVDFNTYMDTFAGHLDGVVIPDLMKKFVSATGIDSSALDAPVFYEKFRGYLIAEFEKVNSGSLNKKQEKLLKRITKELKDFVFEIPDIKE